MLLLISTLVVCLFGSSWAQDSNCDFHQNVQVGQTYYVYSPNYPGNYSRGIQCRWMAYCPSGYNCKLDCSEINLPNTQDCTLDRLLISKTGDAMLSQAERYCGHGSLSVVSAKQVLSVGLIVDRNSPTGRFMCSLTAQPASSPTTCRCGYKKSNRIVGGEVTGVNEYPMMAGLVDRALAQIKCGAVIISARHLLTAAHCVTAHSANTLAVVVGEHDVTVGDSPATQGYQVANFTIHPRWNPNTFDYDIAIVTTQRDMQFSDRVGPVCLPFKFTNKDFAGENVSALGWGTLYPGGPASPVLRKVALQVISQAACRAKNPPFLSQRQICTLTPGKDACQDDSGGPLLYTDRATGLLFNVGIISFGKDCASATSPGVSTRVSAMLSWILSATRPHAYCRK